MYKVNSLLVIFLLFSVQIFICTITKLNKIKTGSNQAAPGTRKSWAVAL